MMEGQQVFYADQGLNQHAQREDENGQINFSEAELKFMHFILETQEQNTYIYR
jgi:DNA-binding transcriptional MerR regulator